MICRSRSGVNHQFVVQAALQSVELAIDLGEFDGDRIEVAFGGEVFDSAESRDEIAGPHNAGRPPQGVGGTLEFNGLTASKGHDNLSMDLRAFCLHHLHDLDQQVFETTEKGKSLFSVEHDRPNLGHLSDRVQYLGDAFVAQRLVGCVASQCLAVEVAAEMDRLMNREIGRW